VDIDKPSTPPKPVVEKMNSQESVTPGDRVDHPTVSSFTNASTAVCTSSSNDSERSNDHTRSCKLSTSSLSGKAHDLRYDNQKCNETLSEIVALHKQNER